MNNILQNWKLYQWQTLKTSIIPLFLVVPMLCWKFSNSPKIFSNFQIVPISSTEYKAVLKYSSTTTKYKVVAVSFSIPTRTTENFSHLMIFHFNKLLFFQALLNTLEQSHKELKRLFRLVKVNNISYLALFVRVARLPSFFAYVEHGFFGWEW